MSEYKTSLDLKYIEIASTDSALDYIYEVMDELMNAGEFDVISEMLDEFDVKQSNVDILLGLLTSTLPAALKIKSRPKFFDRVKCFLIDMGEYEKGLLKGLDHYEQVISIGEEE